MKKIIELLHTGGYSCVISNNGETRTYTKQGVMDLYELLENDSHFLKGASVADKVVGKAAAALMIMGGVTHIYAEIISDPAISLFENTKIDLRYGNVVPFIENKDKSGVCPLENRCSQANTLQEIYNIIENVIKSRREHANI